MDNIQHPTQNTNQIDETDSVQAPKNLEAITVVDQWRDLLNAEPLYSQVVAITIDETQCMYKWSTDFRLSYARLHVHVARSLLPGSAQILTKENAPTCQ